MPRLYAERADLYDIVYQWKDYAGETARVVGLLEERGIRPGDRLLEAACGTGGHLVHLAERYRVAGFDLSADMLAVARPKLPGVPLWQADMVEVRPDQVDAPYDALVCLFSSIGYLLGEVPLRQAFARLAALVRPGGVVLVEPWLDEGSYRPGRPSLQTAAAPSWEAEAPELFVARGGVSQLREQDGMRISVMDLHYLVVPAGGPVQTFRELHELWLCPRELLVDAARGAGLDVTWLDQGLMPGRGLLACTRRQGGGSGK